VRASPDLRRGDDDERASACQATTRDPAPWLRPWGKAEGRGAAGGASPQQDGGRAAGAQAPAQRRAAGPDARGQQVRSSGLLCSGPPAKTAAAAVHFCGARCSFVPEFCVQMAQVAEGSVLNVHGRSRAPLLVGDQPVRSVSFFPSVVVQLCLRAGICLHSVYRRERAREVLRGLFFWWFGWRSDKARGAVPCKELKRH